MSDLIKQVSITTDGKPVISGLFRVYETEGIPLETLFISCQNQGLVPSWIDLYKEMRSAGMKHNRIISKLEEAIVDSFGKEWSDIVISKLESIFSQTKK